MSQQKQQTCPQYYSTDIKILQQSQSKLALEYLTIMGIKPNVKELFAVTDVFVQLCLRTQDDELRQRVIDLDKWIEKKTKK